MFKNHAEEVSDANCHARLSTQNKLLKKSFLIDIRIFAAAIQFSDEMVFTGATQNVAYNDQLPCTCCNKEDHVAAHNKLSLMVSICQLATRSRSTAV